MIGHRLATTGDALLMKLACVLTVEGHGERSPLAISSTLDSSATPGGVRITIGRAARAVR
jgi:hypothetical protein